jgi:FkbM family methyltransferase
MKIFEKWRPRDTNIEKPISSKKQTLTYYAFNEPALNGFSKELSEARDGKNNYKIEFTRDLKTFTLEEILDEYLPSGQIIDFLSIDVEGIDFEVLKSINLKRYRPRVVLIEILGSSLSDMRQEKICMFLEDQNYFVFAKAVNTVFFKSGTF